MNRKLIITGVIAIFVCIAAQQSGKDTTPVFAKLRSWIIGQLSETHTALARSRQKGQSLKSLKQSYRKAREHYKTIEWFIEYCSPREAKFLVNGPLVPKHDEEQGIKVYKPNGFQRLEEMLFTGDTAGLYIETLALEKALQALQDYYATIEIEDGMVLEMCQLELFRIATMNISGYDATISLHNIDESAYCIRGIAHVADLFAERYSDNKAAKNFIIGLQKQLRKTRQYMHRHSDYNKFDRLHFITRYIIPLNAQLVMFHNSSGLAWSNRKQALNLNSTALFSAANFNKRYFSIYYNDTLNLPQQAELGRLLFYDPILSVSNTVSCATCHEPGKAFTDGRTRSITLSGDSLTLRNAPSLLNVVYQKAFFSDGRAYQLEQQVFDVVHNASEMGGNLDASIVELKRNKKYKLLFSKAFAGTSDSAITQYAIKKAITEYENTLISFNSRFDQYLAGTGTLTAAEINGYNIFAGKALCGSCHFMPLFNGTVPPFYNDSEFEVIGTPGNDKKSEDEDFGRYNVTGLLEHKHAFKTPTLRNVAYTAPYMHNGVYKTLEEVVDFYHQGGGKGLKLNYPNQTLPFDSLHLSNTEKANLVLFMRTLSDTLRMKN